MAICIVLRREFVNIIVWPLKPLEDLVLFSEIISLRIISRFWDSVLTKVKWRSRGTGLLEYCTRFILNLSAKNSGFFTVADKPITWIFGYKYFNLLIKPFKRVPLSSSSIIWISSIRQTPRFFKSSWFALLII